MYYFDFARSDELVPFPGEADLLHWDDYSDADDVGVRILGCGDLSVQLTYDFVKREWEAVVRNGESVLKEMWPDTDVATNLEDICDLARLME